jgi:hypothetical protein
VPGPTPPPAPLKEGVPDPLSDAMKAGKWDVSDVQGEMIKEFKEKYTIE